MIILSAPTLTRHLSISLAAAVAIAAASLHADVATTTPPAGESMTPATRPAQEVVGDIQRSIGALKQITARGMADQLKREGLAEQAAPLAATLFAALDEFAATNPAAASQVAEARVDAYEQLAALGDAAAQAKLDAMSSDAKPAERARGKVAELRVRWLRSAGDATRQATVISEFEALAKAEPTNLPLTIALATSSQDAATPELTDRMLAAALAMDTPAAPRVKAMQEQVTASRKLQEKVGKPFAIDGTTPDGTAFSTEAWKGKVVLVDFWATWCGPCVASLPEIEALYAKHHERGFEIVGVSNDFSLDALTKFVKQRNIPWTITFDASAAQQHQWHPTTTSLGIVGIPHMMLIGRDGALISADARAALVELVEKAMAR